MSQVTPPPVYSGPGVVLPHRGTTILVLGVLSLMPICVGWILGIIAWAMGNGDLREMDAGRMDPSGRGMVQAGKICGMISVILHIVAVGTWVLLVVLGIAGAAAGAAAGGGH
jgi:hypothetical protein